MDNRVTLGLDVAKRSIEVCLLSSNGRVQKTSIDNSKHGFQKLLCWLHGYDLANIHVCLEPTGKYSRAIAAYLHATGVKISQVNSYTVLCHGRSKNYRSKTDRIDAYLLADFCLKENPPAWSPPAPSQTELSELQARIADIEEMIIQERNRLEAVDCSTTVRLDIEEHLAQLMVRKQRLEKASRELVKSEPILQNDFAIINSVIGLGEKSAMRLLALVRFDQFKIPRNVGCFAGLTPKQYRSGTSVYKRDCISRIGSTQLRKSMYFPAMVAMQHNPQMRYFAERLEKKGKPPKVIICAVMRKLLVLAATLIRNQEYYDPTKGLSSTI
jgi:transposase